MRRSVARAKTDEDKAKEQQALEEWLPTFEAELAILQALADEYEDKIYAANKPKPHVYEVSR